MFVAVLPGDAEEADLAASYVHVNFIGRIVVIVTGGE